MHLCQVWIHSHAHFTSHTSFGIAYNFIFTEEKAATPIYRLHRYKDRCTFLIQKLWMKLLLPKDQFELILYSASERHRFTADRMSPSIGGSSKFSTLQSTKGCITFNTLSFANYTCILICVNSYWVISFHFRNYHIEVCISTNHFMCQQQYSGDYVNSAQEFEVDCSSQNTSDTACNPCVQGM